MTIKQPQVYQRESLNNRGEKKNNKMKERNNIDRKELRKCGNVDVDFDVTSDCDNNQIISSWTNDTR